MPDQSSPSEARRQKFKHTQSVATTSIVEAVEVARDQAFAHYGSIGTDVVFDDAEPVIEIVVKVRGTYVPDEVRQENHLLKSQMEDQRRQLEELQARLSSPSEPSP